MKKIRLGKTEIITPQNAFGALPIQRVSVAAAVSLLRRAYEGGMTFFDTARAYTDSEEKMGLALEGIRDKIFIATKTMAKTGDELKKELETSLKNLKTDHVDLYQLHCVPQCFRPGDGTGLYETLVRAKEQGMIKHIGCSAHQISAAEEVVQSGLYESVQYPFSYLASEREIALVNACRKADMGFIAMKGLSGGLLTDSRACMAFMSQFDNVLPIWGIQREKELDEWLSFFNEEAVLDEDIKAVIEADRKELSGDFCRSCGYCSPCTVGIIISQCARMSQMIRRMPSESLLTDHWKKEMERIEDCVDCSVCMTRCPYSLNIPQLLRKNLEDYREIIAGRRSV